MIDIETSRKEAYMKRNMNVKEIAKEIRKDFKKAYPDIKISTRISHGQTIRCRIKKIPLRYFKDKQEVFDELRTMYKIGFSNVEPMEWDRQAYKFCINFYWKIINTKEDLNLKDDSHHMSFKYIKDDVVKNLEAIRNFYNYDCSDIMTDYFDVGYYGSIDFDNDEVIITV